MGIVSIEYEIYKCPHCVGFIVMREQYPRDGGWCSIGVRHLESIHEYLKGIDIQGLVVENHSKEGYEERVRQLKEKYGDNIFKEWGKKGGNPILLRGGKG